MKGLTDLVAQMVTSTLMGKNLPAGNQEISDRKV